MSFHSLIFKFLLAFCTTALFCKNEAIRVELSTKQELAPLYLCRVVSDQSLLKSSYLRELREILFFDLQYSGYSKITVVNDLQEKTLRHNDLQIAFNPLYWKKAGVDIVLKIEAIENKLNLYAFNAKTASLKKFENIPLSGDIVKDKMQMHKLSAALITTLFGAESITTTRLLYSVQRESQHPNEAGWKAEIWECDYDGGNPHQVTFEDNYSITPVFIPYHPEHGGDRYLYVNYKNGQPKIYYNAINKKVGKPLVKLRGNQLLPAISNDRSKIAFISDATGRADLFLQNIDDCGHLIEKPKQLFSYPRSTQASPTFSPDGSKIAFVSDKDGTPRIYLIPIESRTNRRAIPKLLTKTNRENTCPNWSPDGTKLAYSAKTNNIRQIWIYDFDLKKEIQLTNGPGNKENPVWASNSLHLVFNSTDPDHSELYLINLNQPGAVKLTSGPGKKHYPTWGKR